MHYYKVQSIAIISINLQSIILDYPLVSARLVISGAIVANLPSLPSRSIYLGGVVILHNRAGLKTQTINGQVHLPFNPREINFNSEIITPFSLSKRLCHMAQAFCLPHP